MVNEDDKRPTTEAQIRYIRQIEELLGVSFSGSTIDEASNFIDEYKGLYQAKLHTPHKYR